MVRHSCLPAPEIFQTTAPAVMPEVIALATLMTGLADENVFPTVRGPSVLLELVPYNVLVIENDVIAFVFVDNILLAKIMAIKDRVADSVLTELNVN